jgi:hypothetical protein
MSGQVVGRVRTNGGLVSPLVNKQPRINSTPRKVSLFDKLKTDDKFKKHLKGLLEAADSAITHKQLKGYKKNELLDMLLLQTIIKEHISELNNLIKEMKELKPELDLFKYEYRNSTNLATEISVMVERLTNSASTPNVNIYNRLKNHLAKIDEKIKKAQLMITREIEKELTNSKRSVSNIKSKNAKVEELKTLTNKLNTLQTQHSSLTSHAHSTILQPQQPQQLQRYPKYNKQPPVSFNKNGPLYGGSPKKTTKKKSTTTRKKKTSTAKKSPKIHIGKRGGRYIIRKGRKIYQ